MDTNGTASYPPLPVPICTHPVPIHPHPTEWPSIADRDAWFSALADHGYGPCRPFPPGGGRPQLRRN